MNLKKAVIYLTFLSLFSIFVYAQPAFRDVGYDAYPFGIGFFGGFNPLDDVCFNYSWLVDFVVFFIFFYFVAHQVFGKQTYKKGDLGSLAVAFALSFGLSRWAASRGGGFLCGILSGGFGFGGLFGLLILLLVVFGIIWAFLKGSNASRLFAAIAYIIFYFWLGSEGGYIISGWAYYIPVDPFLVQWILYLLFLVAILLAVIAAWKWYKEGGAAK
ncbi:MAG: hypothetical protein AABW46_02745 [Nanoarchaeota archaeon]